jgi:uncharacterized membrane protein YqhA
VLKSPRAISRVNAELKTNVSEISVSVIRVDVFETSMETKEISKTLDYNSTLIRYVFPVRYELNVYIKL